MLAFQVAGNLPPTETIVFLNLSAQKFGLHANDRNIFTLRAILWQVGNLCRFLFSVLLFL